MYVEYSCSVYLSNSECQVSTLLSTLTSQGVTILYTMLANYSEHWNILYFIPHDIEIARHALTSGNYEWLEAPLFEHHHGGLFFPHIPLMYCTSLGTIQQRTIGRTLEEITEGAITFPSDPLSGELRCIFNIPGNRLTSTLVVSASQSQEDLTDEHLIDLFDEWAERYENGEDDFFIYRYNDWVGQGQLRKISLLSIRVAPSGLANFFCRLSSEAMARGYDLGFQTIGVAGIGNKIIEQIDPVYQIDLYPRKYDNIDQWDEVMNAIADAIIAWRWEYAVKACTLSSQEGMDEAIDLTNRLCIKHYAIETLTPYIEDDQHLITTLYSLRGTTVHKP